MNKLAIILSIIDGFGFAIIEVTIQSRLGWVKPIWDPSLPYEIGMFIVLSTPWIYWRDFWYWLLSTVIAYLSEDAFYWVLAWQVPHTWGCEYGICIYYVWHGFPIDYAIAIALIITSLFMIKQRE